MSEDKKGLIVSTVADFLGLYKRKPQGSYGSLQVIYDSAQNEVQLAGVLLTQRGKPSTLEVHLGISNTSLEPWKTIGDVVGIEPDHNFYAHLSYPGQERDDALVEWVRDIVHSLQASGYDNVKLVMDHTVDVSPPDYTHSRTVVQSAKPVVMDIKTQGWGEQRQTPRTITREGWG